MIDFHTHILPGIDDGSRDMDMTIRMLEMERDQGVSHICATPHFYAHRRSVEFFLERRDRALTTVRQELADRSDLPQITAGAEVLYFRGMEQAELLPKLCIGETDLLLLEMPFAQWTEDMAKAVEIMIRRRGLRIILAHTERYLRFQKDKSAWEEILSMPLTIQLNGESFLDAGSFFRSNKEHRFCLQMLEERDDCILGSDCHNLTDRRPNLAEARAVIEKKLGAGKLAELDRYVI